MERVQSETEQAKMGLRSTDRCIAVLFGLVIGFAIYIPIGVFVFDRSLLTMLERAYFTFGGAIIALYAASPTNGEG